MFHEKVGKNETAKTVSYMISVIDRANDIFKSTDWLDIPAIRGINPQRHKATGFGFRIAKIEIWNDPTKPDRYLNHTQILRRENKTEDEKEHPECVNQPDSRDICRYLKQFSKTGNHDDVCLAHLFTYHDFDAGILGLAHIGKPSGDDHNGMGICANGKDKHRANQNTGDLSANKKITRKRVSREHFDLN